MCGERPVLYPYPAEAWGILEGTDGDGSERSLNYFKKYRGNILLKGNNMRYEFFLLT